MDKHFQYFLEAAADYTPAEIDLEITTNFTLMNDKLLELFQRLPRLALNISVDGIGKTYDWIRGHDFKALEKKLFHYLPQLPDASIFLNFSTSVYSVGNIEEFYHWAADLGEKTGKSITINFGLIVTWPAYLDPRLHLNPASVIEKIERISEDPRGIADSYLLLSSLAFVKEYMQTELKPDATLLAAQDRWHKHLIGMRGWDIHQGDSSPR